MTTDDDAQRASRASRLTRDRVLQAAIGLADQGGLESLSMRKLGQELGVEAMALYYHFANKDELVDGIVDLVFGEIELPVAGADWKTVDAAARDLGPRRPVAPPLGDRPDGVATKPGPGEPAPPRRGHRQPARGGLRHGDGRPRVLAPGRLHLRLRPHEDEPAVRGFRGGRGRWREAMLEPFPADEYPNLVAFITEHIMEPGYDFGDEFEYGLDLILDGLERRAGDRLNVCA